MTLNTEQRAALVAALAAGVLKVGNETIMCAALDSLCITPSYATKQNSGKTHSTYRLTPLGETTAKRLASRGLVSETQDKIADMLRAAFPDWNTGQIQSWQHSAHQAASASIHNLPISLNNVKQYLAGAQQYVDIERARFDAMRANQERRRNGLTQSAARQARRSR